MPQRSIVFSTLWTLCLPLSLCTNLCVVSPLWPSSCLCRMPSVPLSSISVNADRKWLAEPMMSSCVFSRRHLIVALLAVWSGAKCTAGCSDVMVTTPNRQQGFHRMQLIVTWKFFAAGMEARPFFFCCCCCCRYFYLHRPGSRRYIIHPHSRCACLPSYMLCCGCQHKRLSLRTQQFKRRSKRFALWPAWSLIEVAMCLYTPLSQEPDTAVGPAAGMMCIEACRQVSHAFHCRKDSFFWLLAISKKSREVTSHWIQIFTEGKTKLENRHACRDIGVKS